MLDELAQAQDFTRCAELFLRRLEWLNRCLRVVGAEEVPCVEAGEVLDGSEELVAADCSIPPS